MPTYSYEHKETMADGCPDIFEVVQSIKEDAYTTCPTCHAPVKRIIASPVAFSMPGGTPKFHG